MVAQKLKVEKWMDVMAMVGLLKIHI